MSGSDEEDYTPYGTPLEPIDEDTIPRKKPIAIEEQVVTDEHGRRRFHGAFTGGFSAGFFNTVGSLEGWKPSSFKSSRSSKAESHVQRPEDFMDDEDRDEFGIAPTVLRAKPEYGGSRGTKRPKQRVPDGPIPGEPVLRSILEPVRETVGVRMLMRMGWRPGQGVGAKMTRLEKKRARQREKKAHKPSGDDGKTETDSDDSDAENLAADILFAPDEKKQFLVKPKEDTFGMGYKGLDKRPVLSHFNLFESNTLKLQENKKKLSIRGQAFGVGAFEEEDEDIYSKDDLSQYDYALESHSTLKALRKEEKKKKLLAIKNSPDSIEGFAPGKVVRVKKKLFPLPELPKGFRPNPRRSRFDPSEGLVERGSGNLSSADRAVIIGETLSQKEMEDIPLPPGTPPPNTTIFRPFDNDYEKQARYEKYLNFIRIGAKDAFSRFQPSSMTEWEKEREATEFDKAAKLYAPLSGYMAERFTPSTKKEVPEEVEVAESEMAAAARMGMYGKLTREVSEWTPCALVCKRFNIPQPHADETLAKMAEKKNKGRLKFSIFDFLEASKHNCLSSLQCDATVKQEPSELESETVAQSGSEEQTETSKLEQTETPQVSTTTQAKEKDIEFEDPQSKIDLFKAIFLSGSENESEDEEAEGSKNEESREKNKKEWGAAYPGTDASSINALRNTSPPRGIFANIDLEALSVKTKIKTPDAPPEAVEDPLLYGPRLPSAPRLSSVPPPTLLDSSSSESEEEWVEKGSNSKEKIKKKSKKHKKDKKKSKHKHKKKKKHR